MKDLDWLLEVLIQICKMKKKTVSLGVRYEIEMNWEGFLLVPGYEFSVSANSKMPGFNAHQVVECKF